MSNSNITRRLSRSRGLAIASLVVAIVCILSCVGVYFACSNYLTQMEGFISSLLAEPVQDNEFYNRILDGTGTEADYNTLAVVLVAVIAAMAIFAGVVNVLVIAASIYVIRAVKRPNTKRITYFFVGVGAACAFIVGNIVCGVLLTIAAVSIYRDYVEVVGESVAYKDGAKLGFIRVLQVYYIIHIVASAILLSFVMKDNYYLFRSLFWVGFIKMIMEAVFLWFTWNRKQHGREVIMGMTVVYLLLYIAVSFASGNEILTFGLVKTIFSSGVIFCYFAFAKRPRAIFTEPFRTKNRESQLAEEEKLWNPRSWRFWRNLLLYFCVFSVIGHWMEWCVCWVIRIAVMNGINFLGTFDPNSGIWHNLLNPFFVYGAAIVLIGLILYPMRNFIYRKISNRTVAFVLCILLNTVIVVGLEFAMGIALNTPDPVTGKLKLWDYSDMPFNFMGQVCLLNSTFFVVVATLCTNLVYPNLEKQVAKVPDDIMNIATVVILVFFVLVVCMYVADLNTPFMKLFQL